MQVMPKLDRLERVIAVGQQKEADGVLVSILSIEMYEDGFLVHCRAQLDGDENLALARTAVAPNATALVLEVTDDLGTKYLPWPRGAGGSDVDYRWETAFVPAVRPRAGRLRIAASAIRLIRHPHAGSSEVSEQDLRGPWSFEVTV